MSDPQLAHLALGIDGGIGSRTDARLELDQPGDLSGQDAVVLMTAHSAINYAAMLESSRVLVDLCGATRKLAPEF